MQIGRFKLKMDATEKSSVINFITRPIGMVLGIIYTPVLLKYLGEEANGVWATVLSFITWINYCDLGIGNGMRNCLAKDLATKDYNSAKRTVSTSYIVLTVIAAIILALLLCISLLLDWNSILKTSLSVRPMMVITAVFIVINFVLALSNSMLYALQMSEKVSIRGCIVQVINISVLLLLLRTESGNLTHMALLFGASTALVYIYNTFNIMKKNKHLTPSVSCFDKIKISGIMGVGTQFFVIQLTAVLILSSQNFLVANFFGAASVTPLNTANTAFAALYSVLAALVVPLWSRTTEAVAKGEFDWVRKSMKKTRNIAAVFAVFLIVFSLIFEKISEIWLNTKLDYSGGIIVVTCVFYIVQILNLVFVQFYYGMGEIKPYVWITVIQAALIVPLARLLSLELGMGVAGVKLASALLLLVSGIILPFLTYGKLNELEKRYKAELRTNG